MTKLIWSETFQDLWEVYDDLLGEAATLDRVPPIRRGRPRGRCTPSPCGPGRSRSGAAPARSSATSPPSACSACRGRGRDVLRTHRRPAGVRRRRARLPRRALRPGRRPRGRRGHRRRRQPGRAVEGRGGAGLARRHRARGVRGARARPASRPRSSRGRSARGWRRGRGAAPCSPPRRSGWPASSEQKATWLPPVGRGRRRRGARQRRDRGARRRRVRGDRRRRRRHRTACLVTGASGTPPRLLRRHRAAGRTSPAARSRSSPRPRRSGPGRGARGRRPGRHRARGAHPHGRLRPRARAVRGAGRLVPVDQAHAGRSALHDHHGRARRALRRARRRGRGRRTPRWPSPSPRPRRATRRWRAPAR